MEAGTQKKASSLPRGWANDADHYGRVSQGFHWIIALLMIVAVAMGLLLDNWPREHPTRDAVMLVHKSLGLIVLTLSLLRLSWFLQSPAPPPAAGLKLWERRAAWTVHKLLYLLMFGLPLSGILLSQAVGKDVSLFGWVTLPQIVPVDPTVPVAQRPLVIAGAVLHSIIFKFALLLAIAFHVAGAIKHAFVDRDPAMFRRMWGR